MKKNNGISVKALLLLMVVGLLIGGTIGGTFAWLSTKTESVVNTFVAGDIQIELKEHVLDTTTGKWKSPEEYTDTGNQGILVLPGRTLQKDPTVTVLKGSEPCYLRVLLKVHWTKAADSEFESFTYNKWFTFDNAWSCNLLFDGTTNNNSGKFVGYDIYELTYHPNNEVVNAATADRVINIIPNMTIPAELTNNQITALKGCGMTFIAQAIQSDGFDSASEAFAAAGYPDGWQPPSSSNP